MVKKTIDTSAVLRYNCFNDEIKERCKDLGITDKQFNAYLRGLKNKLEKAIELKDWKLAEELLDEIRQSMED